MVMLAEDLPITVVRVEEHDGKGWDLYLGSPGGLIVLYYF